MIHSSIIKRSFTQLMDLIVDGFANQLMDKQYNAGNIMQAKHTKQKCICTRVRREPFALNSDSERRIHSAQDAHLELRLERGPSNCEGPSPPVH